MKKIHQIITNQWNKQKTAPGFDIALLVLAVLVFFAWQLGSIDAIITRPGAQVSDLLVTFWPNIEYIKQTLSEFGMPPLWRTLIFSGSPFDVDPQSGIWYLPNLVHLIFPAAVGFNLLFMLHTIAGGWGMRLWAQSSGISRAGAWLAAFAYAFTPRTFSHLGFGHVGLVYAAAYIPWVLWAGGEVGRGRWRRAGAFGLALGGQIILHPQLALYTGAVAGVYALALIFAEHRRTTGPTPWKAIIGGGVLASTLALAVSAAQLLPMLRFAPLSARAHLESAKTVVSSLPLRYLWGLILADHRGFMDYMLYVGLPVLALAVLGINRRRRCCGGWFWGIFVGLALLYALGDNAPLYGWMARILPLQTWLRAPARIWFLAAAALAFLAGGGMDRLVAGARGRGRRALNLSAAALGSLSLGLGLGYALVVGTPPLNLIALGVAGCITAAFFFLAASKRLPRRTISLLILCLVVADLWVMDATLIQGQPFEEVFSEHALAQYLEHQSSDEPYRVYSPSYSLPRHWAARCGIETSDGVDPLYLANYDAFMEAASGVERTRYSVTVPAMEGEGDIGEVNRNAVPDPKLLGLLNVRYVAAEFPLNVGGLQEIERFGSTYLYENQHFLPRAFVVGDVESRDDFESALAWVQSHDVARSAAVEDGKTLKLGDVRTSVIWRERSPNKIILDVNLDAPGLLVLSQVFYPGWEAVVGGQPASLHRVDAVLSGLYLEAGEHNVVLSYRPPALWVGVGLSFLSLMVCLVLIYMEVIFAKHGEGVPSEGI